MERFVIPRRTVRYNDLGDREDVGQLGILMHSYAPQIAIVGPGGAGGPRGAPRRRRHHLLQRRTRGDRRGSRTRARADHRLPHSPHLSPRRGGRQPLGTTLVYKSAHAQSSRKESGPSSASSLEHLDRSVVPNCAAAAAGIRGGDRVIEAQGAPSLDGSRSRADSSTRRAARHSRSRHPVPRREVTIGSIWRVCETSSSDLDRYLGATPYCTVHLRARTIRGRGTTPPGPRNQTTGKIAELWLAIRRMATLDRASMISAPSSVFRCRGHHRPAGHGPIRT